MLVGYYNKMVEPKPLTPRTGDAFRTHQQELRRRILLSIGLSPLPERVPLDVQELGAVEHAWCTVRAVTYQLWPSIQAKAFLYTPKEPVKSPAPAMLCPAGHWPDGNAHPAVQTRCLNFARLGYVVLSTTQHHYEDLAAGISHQTLMVWNNMRGLDFLQALPDVDGQRIGCAGCSGGGLQTQMLAALDERVRAATIVGITCDYREIMFPYRNHCACNHWPGAMQFTDQPEIAALALPRPIQFLTMDDWTKNFERDNLPQIRALYDANGVGGRIDHQYWPTPHEYDRAKRERTYWWMERWLRGEACAEGPSEPETDTFEPQQLVGLFGTPDDAGAGARDFGFEGLSVIYLERPEDGQADSESRDGVDEQREALAELLGLSAVLPRSGEPRRAGSEDHEGLVLERVAFPSEGSIFVSSLLLHDDEREASHVHVYCDHQPKEERLSAPEVLHAARSGALVVLPDVRFVGALSLERLKGHSKELVAFPIAQPYDEQLEGDYAQFWTRNGILWGRPLPGMTATDILAVIDGVLAMRGGDGLDIHLAARGETALGALFAACLDDRVRSFDIDLGDGKFADRTLPLVPNILRHGDVDHWLRLAEAIRHSSAQEV